MRQKKAKKIIKDVKSTYDIISEDFDLTRQIPVKEFNLFKSYLNPGITIVDLGCGNGRLLKSLRETGKKWPRPAYHYLGIDNSEKMLRLAKKNFPHENFIKGDQLHIPVSSASTGIIFNIRSFHHIPGKRLRLQALNEMKRILKPDGILIITVWNLWQKKNLKLILKAVLRFFYTLGSYGWNDFFVAWGKKAKRYYHAFTPMELHNIVHRAGLEIEEEFCVKEGKRVPFRQSHDIVIIAKKINQQNES